MSRRMHSVLITGDGSKPRVADEVKAALPVIRRIAKVVAVDLDESHPLDKLRADMALVFGGDGAILKAVRRLGANNILVCGINLGKLGFLATLTGENAKQEIRAVLNGEYTVTTALKLACVVRRGGRVIHRSIAVNDAVVSRGALSRIVQIDVLIDRYLVGAYNGDGLIVSTPLGSTAHSLSAGGPIVEPGLDSMILTPICPHTLSNRPIVLPATRTIEMRLSRGPEGVALTVDGQVFQGLQASDAVEVSKASKPLRLVRAAGHNYYRTLHEKLGWSGRIV